MDKIDKQTNKDLAKLQKDFDKAVRELGGQKASIICMGSIAESLIRLVGIMGKIEQKMVKKK